jgi:hypothetical protein
MNVADIWRVARDIPGEWYDSDSVALTRLTEELYRRRSKIRGLITNFRNSNRNPFPNWADA